MVDPTSTESPPPTAGTAHPPADKALFWKSAIYTAVFLLFVLGAVPWAAHYGYLWIKESLKSSLGPGITTAQHWIGGIVFVVGLVAYLICSCWLMFFGKGPHVEFDPPKEFVATGPYRWCRNPVVITLILTVMGEAIYVGSMGILLFVLLVGIPFAHLQVSRIEEPRLRKRFGETYIAYCSRVPRWMPKRPTD